MRLIRARGGGGPRQSRKRGLGNRRCGLRSPPVGATHRASTRSSAPSCCPPIIVAGGPTASSEATRACLQRRRSAGAGRSSRHHPPGRHHPRHHQPRQSLPLRQPGRARPRDGDRPVGRSGGRLPGQRLRRPSPSAGTAAFRSPTSSGARAPVVCVPKTIDNDVGGTQRTFGFDSAVSTATEALDKVHLRRRARPGHGGGADGPLRRLDRLYSGLSGSADVILIPRSPSTSRRCARRSARGSGGRRFSIVVAEGARPSGGDIELVERRGSAR